MKITLTNIRKHFGAVKALDGVSFSVGEGECFFLLGPSGCGKTTLLRCIAGFCKPDSGAIEFDGRPVGGLAAHLRNTGMVFQNYALWPHLTVEENIAFGLTVPGRRPPPDEKQERVRRTMAMLRLDGLGGRMPGELSGGQQQRVALARALVIQPACLLFDEPLSNLDAKLRMEMRLEIRRIVKSLKITAVYVTHDQAEALCMADRCAVMRAGLIEQVGTPRELYERPANGFIADFMGCANLLSARVAAAGETLALEAPSGRWTARAGALPVRAGDEVCMAIRAESVVVEPGPAAAPNRFAGRVIESVYMGAAIEYRIELGGGTVLSAVRQGSGHVVFQPGQAVGIAVAPDMIVVLPARDE